MRLPLVSLVLLCLASGAAAQVRDVTVGVSAEDGSAVFDLGAEDFRVMEDGEERPVIGLARDQRPVDVALILDTSEPMREVYRTTLVPAAMDFWAALPEWARLTIWTSGGRAHQTVPLGTPVADGRSALEKVATGGVRFTLHAMISAAERLEREPLARRLVVVVTGDSIPYERNVIRDVVRVLPEKGVTPVVIMIKHGTSTRIGGTGITWEVEPFFRDMVRGYGGSLDIVTSELSVSGALKRTAAELTSQYVVRFESPAESPFQPAIEVAREGVRARPGLAMRVEPGR